MDETDGPEIRYGLRTVLFRQKHDIGCVDDVEIGRRKLGKGIDDGHKVILDDIPARAKEGDSKTVRARSLVRGHVINSLLYLILTERQAQILQRVGGEVQGVLVEVQRTRRRPT